VPNEFDTIGFAAGGKMQDASYNKDIVKGERISV